MNSERRGLIRFAKPWTTTVEHGWAGQSSADGQESAVCLLCYVYMLQGHNLKKSTTCGQKLNRNLACSLGCILTLTTRSHRKAKERKT